MGDKNGDHPDRPWIYKDRPILGYHETFCSLTSSRMLHKAKDIIGKYVL